MRCVPAHHFTIAKARAWRSAIEERPPYQRESAVWSLDKQQLFIDSLLNGYDVPKIYLHDLRGQEPTKVYSIVDGKQRLTAIWAFLDDAIPLAPDFRVEAANLPEGLPATATAPAAGQRFSELDRAWREVFLRTYLSVVLIRHATEPDIEALFARLNNGEPLNAAEKRNALGGAMARIVRDVASRPFFLERLHFSNGRYQHYELAARMLAVAMAAPPDGLPDLRPSALDAFVRAHRDLPARDARRVSRSVDAALARMAEVFEPADPLLTSPSYGLLYFLLVRSAPVMDAPGATIRAFLATFQRERLAALEQPDDEHAEPLVEFSGLMQHGAQDRRSVARRLEILERAWVDYRAATGAGTSSG
jgi:hypothetical protein